MFIFVSRGEVNHATWPYVGLPNYGIDDLAVKPGLVALHAAPAARQLIFGHPW
jgi:hypothetical protein